MIPKKPSAPSPAFKVINGVKWAYLTRRGHGRAVLCRESEYALYKQLEKSARVNYHSLYLHKQVMGLSAMGDSDFTRLGRALFDLNRIIRVYSKTPGKNADKSQPHVLHRGDCLMDFARVVHKDFAEKLRYAKAWGEGMFDGQRIQRDQELLDGFVVELHM